MPVVRQRRHNYQKHWLALAHGSFSARSMSVPCQYWLPVLWFSSTYLVLANISASCVPVTTHSLSLLYVALSRVTSIDELYIVPKDNDNRFYHGRKNDTSIISLQDEFRRLSLNTLSKIGRTILDFMNDRKKLSMVTFNCQSLRKHVSDLSDPAIDSSNILFLSETWSNDDENIDIPNFDCIAKFKRKNVRSAGVAIYQKSNNTSNIVTSNMDILLRHIREVDIGQSSIGDICAAHCVLDDGTNIIMVVVYISPNNTVNNIIKFIYRRLMIYGRVGSEELGENYHTLPLILAGDFNINFASEDEQLLINFLRVTLELQMNNDHMDIMEYTNIDGYLLIRASIVFVFFYTKYVRYKINSFFIMSSKIKNCKAHSQAREIIWNVFKYFKDKNEYMANCRLYTMTGEATGYSTMSVRRIVYEGKKNMDLTGNSTLATFITPDKKRNNVTKIKALVDDFDRCALKRTITNVYTVEKIVPTVKLIFEKQKNFMNLGSTRTLNRIISEMGFKFRKTETNRKFLIEKHNIRLKRIEYLKKILEFRRQGRKIVYTDESYVLSSHVVNKSWSSVDDDNTVKQSLCKGKRLIIVHAGGEEGFVPNALLTWEAQSSSGDYHDNMNKDNYYKWVTEKLLPNLSKNSVVVLDNATYHCHQSNRAPNSNSLKKDMINWLTENNISFNSTMFKPQLYDIIRKHKQVFIKYSLDGILSKEGHDIIRLPPYHPDLNPIEMIWSQVKQYIAKQNHNGSIKKIAELCKQKMESMGNSEWRAVCANVKKLETEMWKNESYMDIEMDKLIVTYGEDTTDDSDTSTEDEDDDLGVAPLQP
ncbi:hypothetical protein QTP88_026955 [Uroleucon formosanum]